MLSDDPLEQFLIAEAVMSRHHEQRSAAMQRERDRIDARRRAQEQLDRSKGRA